MSTLSQFVGGSPIKSIQRGTISLGASVLSNTATISSVDTSKTQLNWLGVNQVDYNVDRRVSLVSLALTNSTTVTATRQNGTSTTTSVSYEVIEYN